MLQEKFYTCKYDRAFKEIMLNENNKVILKKLLEQILKVEIKEIEFKPTELNTGNIGVKRKTLDVLLLTNIGKIGIEINGFRKNYVRPRNMAYICDIYAHHTLVGETYDEETQIIQINFSYELNKEEKEAYRIYKIQDKDLKQFVKNFIIYEINMDYYKEIWYHGDEEEIEKNKYIIMLNLEREDLKEISKQDKVAKKYMEELEKLNKQPAFRQYMTAEEDARKIYNTEMKYARETGFKQGIEQGLEQGIEQGIEKGIEQIIKNMLSNKMTPEDISAVTNVSIEVINKINSSM